MEVICDRLTHDNLKNGIQKSCQRNGEEEEKFKGRTDHIMFHWSYYIRIKSQDFGS